MKKISIIIPAYNEEKNIKNIINICTPLLENKIFEIIVVNDCSTDQTLEILQNFSEIKIINNEKNLGKSKSVAKAIEKASGEYILFLDADLLHLETKDIKELIQPIIEEKVDVTLSFRKNSFPLFPFRKIDFCTGERVISKEILMSEIEKIKTFPSYTLEGIINNLIIKNKLRLKVVYWKKVENRYHTDERGLIKGWMRNFKIWREIIKGAGGFFQIYKVNLELRKLLIKDKK